VKTLVFVYICAGFLFSGKDICYDYVQVFFPLGKISVMIYGVVAAGADPRYTQVGQMTTLDFGKNSFAFPDYFTKIQSAPNGSSSPNLNRD